MVAMFNLPNQTIFEQIPFVPVEGLVRHLLAI
jgi:hypothetical protein